MSALSAPLSAAGKITTITAPAKSTDLGLPRLISRPERKKRRFEVAGQEIRTQVCHQDQVVEVPPGARVIGGADYCANGVIEYDFPAMSMQFHPEYPEEFVLGIVEEVEGDLLTPEQAKAARRDAGKPVTNAVFAAEAAAFYRRYLNPAA